MQAGSRCNSIPQSRGTHYGGVLTDTRHGHRTFAVNGGSDPQWVGQIFLCRLYDRLHALNDDPTERPSGMRLYYTSVVLTTKEWLNLNWWEAALWLNVGVQAYSLNQGTLGISFGDGSGSGTGGTIQLSKWSDGMALPNT